MGMSLKVSEDGKKQPWGKGCASEGFMRQERTQERREQNVETQGYCMRANRMNPSPLGENGTKEPVQTQS